MKARPIQPDNGHLWDAMEDLYQQQEANSGKLDALVLAVGQPGTADGGQPASGIFAHLSGHDRRISKFERLWERGLGFGTCCVVVAAPLLTALWWLAGDRITKLLHG